MLSLLFSGMEVPTDGTKATTLYVPHRGVGSISTLSTLRLRLIRAGTTRSSPRMRRTTPHRGLGCSDLRIRGRAFLWPGPGCSLDLAVGGQGDDEKGWWLSLQKRA